MILVILEKEIGYDLLEGTLWKTMDTYLFTSDDHETAIDAALDASQKAWGGMSEWLDWFQGDERLRIMAFDMKPDSLVQEMLYEDIFAPREEWTSDGGADEGCCSCCGSGLNTVQPCPACGELLCQDCADGVHICDPDYL